MSKLAANPGQPLSWSLRFGSDAAEEGYRRHHLHDDARAAAFLIGSFGVAFLFFAGGDWAFFGPSPLFAGLLILRIGFAAGCALAMVVVRRTPSPRTIDATSLSILLAATALNVLIAATRPRGYFFQLVIDVAIFNAFWAFLPCPFLGKATVAACYLVGQTVQLRFFRDPLPAAGLVAVVLAFAFINLSGGALAWRLERSRRLGYLALMHEISGREDLAAASVRAQAADRAKSVFLASVSHEILTPLNSILGFSEVLLRRGHAPEQQEALDAIQSAGRALHGLLVDVLDLARGEVGETPPLPAPCDVSALLGDVARLLAARCADKGLACRTELAADLPPRVLLDAARLRQVLLNLASNAVRYTDAGEVVLRARAAVRGDRADLVLQVTDTGPGIRPEDRGTLFEPFRQGGDRRGDRGGHGLGLWLSASLAQQMGGTLRLLEAGPGSTFELALAKVPLAPEAPSPVPDAALEPALPPGHVLVVDDEPLNRALIRAFLATQPIEIEEAASGEDALVALEARRPAAVLLDLRLPRASGEEVLRWIRRQPRLEGLPVIAVTAAPPSAQRSTEGFDGWLSKPLARRALLETLSDALGGEERFTAAPARLPDELTSELLVAAQALGAVPHVGQAQALAARAAGVAASLGVPELARWAEALQSRAVALDVAGVRVAAKRLAVLLGATSTTDGAEDPPTARTPS